MSTDGREPGPLGFGWRIQPVLVLAMSALVVLSIGTLTAIEAVHEQARYREELVDRGSLLVDVLSRILADALYFDDVERARYLAEVVQTMPEVEHYQVFNREGRVLVDSDAVKYSSGSVDQATLNAVLEERSTTGRRNQRFQIVAPIAVGEEVLGGVTVSLKTTMIAPHVRLMIREHFLYGAIAVGVGILLAVFLGRRLTSPIRRLIKAARAVASGDLRFSAADERGDEIGDLSSAFEEMVQRLEERARANAEAHTAELERANELLRQYAMEDALTGLPNRRLLVDRFSVARGKANRGQSRLALLFLDLDQFKIINDSLGHAAGDEVLFELARRLKAAMREEDTVARLGGDEFILLLSGLEGREEVSAIAEKILEAVRQPVSVGGQEFRLTASLGVSLYPDDGASTGELLRKADIAMYRAKDLGRNSYQLFSKEMEGSAGVRVELDTEPEAG